MPSVSYRSIYRYPSVLEIPKASHSSVMDQLLDRHSLIKLTFSSIVDVYFHGIFSPLAKGKNTLKSINNVLRIV